MRRLLSVLLLLPALAVVPAGVAAPQPVAPQTLRLEDGAELWTIPYAALEQFIADGTFADQRLRQLVARSGWPEEARVEAGLTPRDAAGLQLEVDLLAAVDRRQRDPHDGVLSPNALAEAHRALAGDEPVAVAVILQRLGAGRVLACKRCGELARCGECGRACEETDAGRTCPDGHSGDVTYCTSCGATAFRAVRSGVTTLARDVALQLNCEVTEVTAQSESATFARVVVGTEAVFGRVRRCAAVIFVDADQYLTAPRSTARRAFVEAVGRAGRLVGARREGRGVVVVQTRRPDDEVVLGVVNEDVGELSRDEIDTAKEIGRASCRERV